MMPLAVFHQDARRVFRGRRGKTSPFGHRFGGAADYSGLAAFKRQPPVHLLFRLNMADPAVGVRLPGVQWLPLLCAIRYGACHLGYRVVSDEEIKILHQSETKAWPDFPSAGYPRTLPPQPVTLEGARYDPGEPKDALVYAGIFGYEALTPEQFARLVRYVVDEGIYAPELFDWESPEEYLREGNCWPFVQGRPDEDCPDPACSHPARNGKLRTFAIFQEEEQDAHKLWGPNCESLQIIFQVCPQCGAIRVSNQCT